MAFQVLEFGGPGWNFFSITYWLCDIDVVTFFHGLSLFHL